ncbi:hypothetical protein [Altibacter sp.]|uniref:hypothetical protein n=1 Tax=Altibacter sp. TaxID=2024823 RepID=UPI00258971D6|nr:hypothetical protein [Altibacter sp.]MCW9036651.1 hypothetical protein [Altibacter sp.]
MRRYGLLVLLTLLFCIEGNAQKNISDYPYVVVPAFFEFLKEPDQYQMNSLTKFLLNKEGLNAVFETELPNIPRCDALWADVELSPGFIWTRTYVILKDCNGNEVYRSGEGRSKFKEYKKAFQHSLRNAFEIFDPSAAVLDTASEISTTPKTLPASEKEKEAPESVTVVSSEVAPKIGSSNATYVYGDYTLKALEGGYSILYKNEKIGELVPTARPNNFLAKTSMFNGIGYIVDQGIIIEREVEGMVELVPMKFEMVKN